MFYGGLVRKKNVLSVMMQCLFLMGLMTVIWGLWGYSLAFGGSNLYIGDLSHVFMQGLTMTDGVAPDAHAGARHRVRCVCRGDSGRAGFGEGVDEREVPGLGSSGPRDHCGSAPEGSGELEVALGELRTAPAAAFGPRVWARKPSFSQPVHIAC